MLDVTIRTGRGPRWVLVHGFSQCGFIWSDIANRLACGGREVLAVDLPGHGPNAQHDQADLPEAAQLLGEAGGEGVYVGYSLGARVALHLAVARPEMVKTLVLVGGRLGLESARQRKERLESDEAQAERIEKLARDGRLEEWVDEWLALPFNVRVPQERRYRSLRLHNRGPGLAASLRHCGLGQQDLPEESLRNLGLPLVAVIGQHDLPGVREDADRLARLVPQARIHDEPGSGHALPFEVAPDRFVEILDHYAPVQS